jgi:hypothetical protein
MQACQINNFLISYYSILCALAKMPLQEISGNKVAIPRAQSLPNGPKGPGRGAPKGHTWNTNDKDPHARQTVWDVKVAIVTARFFYKETWNQIEERLRPLGIKKSTASSLYQKAWEVEKKDDFFTIIKHLKHGSKRGPQPIIERGSADSIAIRTAFLKDPFTPQATAARKRGFLVSASTACRIARTYRDAPQDHIKGLDRSINRLIAPEKPVLTRANQESRVKACHQILDIIARGGIIICSDETTIAAMGGQYGKTFFSAPQGLLNSNEFAIPQKDEGLQVMAWYACCSDHSVERPTNIWCEKDPAEKQQQRLLDEALKEFNRKGKEEAEYHRQQSTVQNTPEFAELAASHALTHSKNEQKRRLRQRGRFLIKTPQQLWPWKDETREKKVDWWYYSQVIMLPKLWPYYQAICEANKGREVWLIEDNAPPHVKANRLFADEKKRRGIRTIDWPSNSPDLHPIENTFFDLKKEVSALNLTTSRSNAVFKTLATTICRLLTERPQIDADSYTNFGYKIHARVSNEAFKNKAEACIEHGGRNNFHS